mmetsp:Transcript_9882/g.8719  ORF Transcript_9882/g.8719 Transcript_9882/m.8719 type:complete len:361 (+) Transcript_9882:219-1301(+)
MMKDSLISEAKSNFSFLECPLCNTDLKENRQCNKCAKTYCKSCWDKALAKESKCPNCRENIKSEDLLNNMLFGEFLDRGVIKMLKDKEIQNKSKLTCSKHKKSSDMYCYSCVTIICSKCIFTSTHQDHNIMEYEKQPVKELKKVAKVIGGFRKILGKLNRMKKNVQQQDDFDFENLLKNANNFKKLLPYLDNKLYSIENKYEEISKGYYHMDIEISYISYILRRLRSLTDFKNSAIKVPGDIIIQIKEIDDEIKQKLEEQNEGNQFFKFCAISSYMEYRENEDDEEFKLDKVSLLEEYFEVVDVLNQQKSFMNYFKAQIQKKVRSILQKLQRENIQEERAKESSESSIDSNEEESSSAYS